MATPNRVTRFTPKASPPPSTSIYAPTNTLFKIMGLLAFLFVAAVGVSYFNEQTAQPIQVARLRVTSPLPNGVDEAVVGAETIPLGDCVFPNFGFFMGNQNMTLPQIADEGGADVVFSTHEFGNGWVLVRSNGENGSIAPTNRGECHLGKIGEENPGYIYCGSPNGMETGEPYLVRPYLATGLPSNVETLPLVLVIDYSASTGRGTFVLSPDVSQSCEVA